MSEFINSEQCKVLKEQFYKELQDLLKKHSVELYAVEIDCIVIKQYFGDAVSRDKVDYITATYPESFS
jgi:hypothetical protein